MIRILLFFAVMVMGLSPHQYAMAQDSIYNSSSSKVGGRLNSKGYNSNSTSNYGTKGPIYIKGMLRNKNPKTVSSKNAQAYKPFNFSDTVATATEENASSSERLEGQITSYKEERKQYKADRAKRRSTLLEKYKSKSAIGSNNNNQRGALSSSSRPSGSSRASSSSSSSLSRNRITPNASASNVSSQQRVNPAYGSSRRNRNTSTPSKVFTSY